MKYPHITVRLSNSDGNAYAVIGKVTQGLEQGGERQGAADFKEASEQCRSYDELLQLAMTTVNVE